MAVRSVAGWCLTALLALVFLAVGWAKFRAPAWEMMFAAWGYPAWVRPAVGVVEMACALLLLVPRARKWAALALTMVMIGAAVTHLLHGDVRRIAVNAVLAGLLLVLSRLRDKARTTERKAA